MSKGPDGPAAGEPSHPFTPAPPRSHVVPEILRTACNRDCPDACGIVATVEDGRVLAIAGDKQHPVTRGFLCERTSRYLARQYSPERLKQPLVRHNGSFATATWDEALD